MFYFLTFLVALIFSLILTGYAKKIGQKFGIISKPRSRDVHKKALPRIGGTAIFLSFLIVSVTFYFLAKDIDFGFGKMAGIDKRILGIWLGGFFITGSMLLDDIFGLKAWQKFIFQIITVLVVIASGVGIDTLSNPFGQPINLNSIYIPILKINGITYHFSLLSDVLTLIWLVGMMNVMNFVDGVDGLAGGIAVIAAITIFTLSVRIGQPSTALISIIFGGAAAGFLIWNFPPAKIFMGDCGSMFLGFMLGLLPLISGGKLATVFLVLGFPIVDGLIVAGGRLLRRQNPFTTPDKTHLHHRFLRAGFSARQSILFLYIISIGFAWVALRSSTFRKIIASIILIVLVIIVTRILNIIARKKSPSIS